MANSKWSRFDEQIIALKSQGLGSVNIAKKLLNTEESRRQNPEVESLGKYIASSPKFSGIVKDEDTDNISKTDPNDYIAKGGLSAMKDGKLMNIEDYCQHWGLDYENASSYKLITHTGTPYWNIVFREQEAALARTIDFTAIYKDLVQPISVTNVPYNCDGLFDRLVYSDVHIGMDVNKDGYALYEGTWDEDELNIRLQKMIDKVISARQSKVLYISDLGDLCDGWDGETVRRGHHLPQNMDNQKVFDVGLSFKVKMIDALIPYYDKIVCRNITDDNHSGAFSYIVNSAFKAFIEMKYPDRVEVFIQRKFIDHFKVGNYIFIETHGKDGSNLKFGFKPILDPVNEKKIKTYIEENWLLEKGVKIEFSKGDSHQYIFDHSTGGNFNYYNYPAFSPPSNWVKTNFSNSMSGFVFFNYLANGQKSTHDFIF